MATPLELTPYLQILPIANKPLTPNNLVHMYMPSHEANLHLIPFI